MSNLELKLACVHSISGIARQLVVIHWSVIFENTILIFSYSNFDGIFRYAVGIYSRM